MTVQPTRLTQHGRIPRANKACFEPILAAIHFAGTCARSGSVGPARRRDRFHSCGRRCGGATIRPAAQGRITIRSFDDEDRVVGRLPLPVRALEC